ncbi:MAG: hypothetical protein ACI814_004023, partial [Mariniblastus sp.]
SLVLRALETRLEIEADEEVRREIEMAIEELNL